MKESENDSEINIINTSSKEEIISLNPPELIPKSKENPEEKASIENRPKRDNRTFTRLLHRSRSRSFRGIKRYSKH